MPSTSQEFQLIILEFKKYLKLHRISQGELSQKSKIPLSTIKKVLTGRDYSLNKIIVLLDSVGLSFIDMTSRIRKSLSEEVFMLSESQESFFADNLEYYYFYHKIFKDFLTLKDVKELMKLSESKYWKIIRKLEKFQLLELHSGNKIILRIEKGITLRPDGDLQKAILNRIGKGFNQYLFDEDFALKNKGFPLRDQEKYNSPYLRLYFGKIHPHHYRNLQDRLKDIHDEFVQTCVADRKYYNKNQLIDASWLQGLGVINGMDFLQFNLKS
ncbi:hypothetical protein N9N67_10185 [Bacteriovoracaceae bacterium]|nr:hypothetical protein [Bacteriovoracaceae bacterium]